ncbi:glycosyltransferase family protein [Bacteroidota bacterium]
MHTNKKRFVFLVQGEGRGHMTQAISLHQTLKKNGHEISHVFIGKSKRRIIPDYFYESIDAPITEVDSPNFITDSKHKSIRLIPSIIYNVCFLHLYSRSLKKINRIIKDTQPDGLINFYDFLGSFYMFRYHPDIKYFCIAHQYLTDHPDFIYAEGKNTDKFLFKVNNWLTSQKAYRKLALSFKAYDPLRVGNTVVTPPLLRNDLQTLKTEKEDFILCYMVNPGYHNEIIDWHESNRNTKLHCFWDMKNEPDEKVIHPNLIFHQLNATKFMDMMRRCRGLVTTAGFESVCEAMFLNKPVMMVPVSGQYEQACNAIEASNEGAGIHDTSFNITKFIDYLPTHRSIAKDFQNWHGIMEDTVLGELTDF